MTPPPITPWDTIKHAIMSVLIGTAISLITILLQELIHWLNSIQPAVPGVMAGVGKYLYPWTSNPNA